MMAMKSRFAAVGAFMAAFALVYLGTNRLGPLPAVTLPMAGWEREIPFLPWTVFGYVLAYPVALLVFFVVAKRDLGRTFIGMTALVLVHGIVFLLLPTSYPRPPLPADVAPFIQSFYDALVFFDAPRNCFPSLHAALSVFAALAYLRKDARIGAAAAVLALVTIASTLTLKQHYALDLAAGACTGILAFALVFRRGNGIV